MELGYEEGEGLTYNKAALGVHTQRSVALDEGFHDVAMGGRGRGHEHLVPLHGVQEGPEGPHHLAGRTGWGGGLAPGGLQLLILQLLLFVQLIHCLLVAALPPDTLGWLLRAICLVSLGLLAAGCRL